MRRKSAGGRTVLTTLLALLVLLLAGCGGVPTDSSPRVVRTADRVASSSPSAKITPEPGDGPTQVVQNFIRTGVDSDAGHSTSRQFLTTAAARKWQDNPTVILDSTDNVALTAISGDAATISLTGHRRGTIDATGVYSPVLKGMGSGDEETFNFGLTRVAGQWRIDQLQPGVLIGNVAFLGSFEQRQLYFFDPTARVMVPDPRYSPLDGQALASWLLTQLLTGPRPELAQSVLNEMPDQVGQPSVQVGDPITVELPGTRQLDELSLNHVAAQLAYTLGQVQFGNVQLRLTDSGRPLRIPAANGSMFGESTFSTSSPDSVPSGGELFYVRNGVLVDGEGNALPGVLGPTSHSFVSAAVRQNSDSVQVAAVTSSRQLLIGDERRISPVALPRGALSRPDWHPFTDDAWVGVGNRGAIYRVTSGQPASQVPVTSQTGSLPVGQILTLRFSSDGVRIAVVLRAPGGATSAWVGAVTTSGSDVRIDSFAPVTPPSMSVADVAWADPTRLLLVAAAPGAESWVWQVRSDGSGLDSLTRDGVSGQPTSLAAAARQPPVVSVNGALWTLDGISWRPVSARGSPAPGTNPVYSP